MDYYHSMILLIGPSASGKTEVAKLLMKSHSIRKVVTHTTRPPRIHEVDGVDYHFVDIPTFESLKEKGEFVETTFFSGKYYGSSKKEVADDKVLIVDPAGLDSYLALKDPRVISFYLNTSEEIRKQRMIERGDKKEDIQNRLLNDRKAFANVAPTTFTLENESGSLEELSETIYDLYQKELKKLNRVSSF